MTSEYDRLLQAAELLKGWSTPAQLSRGLTEAGYPVQPAQISNWKVRGVSKEAQLRASKIIGYSLDWLTSGVGEIRAEFTSLMTAKKVTENPVTNNVNSGTITVRNIPLISWVRAGLMCGVVDIYEPGDAEEWIPYTSTCGPHTYALRVVGDSMTSSSIYERSYPAGTVILVDPDRPVLNGSKVIAKLASTDEATFKIFKEDAGRCWLHPLNPSYPVIEVTNDMVICGVVIGGFWQE